MIERIRGFGFGKLAVAFIGVVAMVALITGAVAASSIPAGTPHENGRIGMSTRQQRLKHRRRSR